MNIGRLRHRITIQEYVETKDDHLKVDRSWSTLAVVWGEVKGSYGVEGQNVDTIESRSTYLVTVRYRSDTNAKLRFLYKGRTLEPTSALDPTGKGESMTAVCVEVV